MSKQGTIIVVDDNKGVLSAVKLLLKNHFEHIVTLPSPITLPAALREENAQVVLLDMNFSSGLNTGNEGLYCKQYDKGNILLSTGAQEKLRTYPWYGNIRELEHAVEKAVIINEDGILSEEHFHFPRKIAAPATETSVSTLEEMELQMIQKAIEKCNGNLSAVAAQLGITRQTLYNKMKKFGL